MGIEKCYINGLIIIIHPYFHITLGTRSDSQGQEAIQSMEKLITGDGGKEKGL